MFEVRYADLMADGRVLKYTYTHINRNITATVGKTIVCICWRILANSCFLSRLCLAVSLTVPLSFLIVKLKHELMS